MTSSAPMVNEPSVPLAVAMRLTAFVGGVTTTAHALVTNPFERRRRQRQRIQLDIAAMGEALPILTTYEERLTGKQDPPVIPPAILMEHEEPRFEDDPHADLLAQLERTALGVRSMTHWELRDMLVSLVLNKQFRNEYFVRCLIKRVADCVDAQQPRRA